MFKKLDIFIIKQFAVLFVGALLICQFVLMMQFLWRYVDELIGKGLSLDILAQFFWYMGLMLVPQAIPLAILLSSLITFGNLGESSELTAIKAAGISLMRTLRGLIVVTVAITIVSFLFQNYVAPEANLKLRQLLISMKQKSPELEIPEGIFYDGIPNTNIFVQKKDMDSGKLYGLTIYKMTGSYEDQAIILADSGMLQTTADKKHLMMTLWNGEWFENMKSQVLGGKASVPYRRETFYHKQILIEFDGDFNMADPAILSNASRGKGLAQLGHEVDSMELRRDSLGRAFLSDLNSRIYKLPTADETTKQPNNEITKPRALTLSLDSLDQQVRKHVITSAQSVINNTKSDIAFRAMMARDSDELIRMHRTQEIAKFTLALQCLIFFFIGAPLGAIIRKGGLGLPVIISVLVFIIYYVLDNSGTRMVRIGSWNLWFGCLLSVMVLLPLAVYITYKANDDAFVLNVDKPKQCLDWIKQKWRARRHLFARKS